MDELTRFARRLVEQLTASKEGVNRAVPIGQIREKILPYRTHRRALMLESVEDYETVLLRLVAGERGFVRALPAAAAKRCQDELRKVATKIPAPAQIVADDGDVTLSEATVLSAAKEKGSVSAEAPAPSAAARPQGDKPAAVRPQGDHGQGECRHCHHVMPAGRTVVFCPWCGGRLIPFTCARCQTELDSEWRHCITCGAPVKDPHRYS